MTTIERYILKLLLVPAMMLPLSLAAADETPQQQADRAAEQARIANANAQVALEAARRAQEFAAELGVKLSSSARKAEIIETIQNA